MTTYVQGIWQLYAVCKVHPRKACRVRQLFRQPAHGHGPKDPAIACRLAVAVAGPALLEVQVADVRESAWLAQQP